LRKNRDNELKSPFWTNLRQQRTVVDDMHLTSRFRSYFLRGLAILVPTILTIWIFIWGYNFIQNNISVHINRGLAWVDVQLEGEDWGDGQTEIAVDKKELWTKGWHSIAGFIVALIAVCVVGMILASVVGRSLWRYVEKLIMNVPFIRRVYPYIKQITDFLLVQNQKDQLFVRVVGVEYPRKGIWSIGMVTGEGLPKLVNNFRKEFVTVFVPTSPTPFTGFVIMVPKKETIDLDMTVEEALRFTVSAGVITPATKLEYLEAYRPEQTEKDDSVDQQ
jgi:uncharacterized membrane protein